MPRGEGEERDREHRRRERRHRSDRGENGERGERRRRRRKHRDRENGDRDTTDSSNNNNEVEASTNNSGSNNNSPPPTSSSNNRRRNNNSNNNNNQHTESYTTNDYTTDTQTEISTLHDRELSELQVLCDSASSDDPSTWEAIRRWLRNHSADDARAAAERRGDYETTPLHLACRNCPPLDIVNMLLTASPRTVELADSFGWLPLHYGKFQCCGVLFCFVHVFLRFIIVCTSYAHF